MNDLKKELRNTQAKFAVDIIELKPEEQPIKVMENVEEILNIIASKLPENPYSKRPIPDDPVYNRMYLDKWYGFEAAIDSVKSILKGGTV